MNDQTPIEFPGNYRIHIGLSTANLARSREFYETLFGAPPTKERPGYVKFEPQDPSVNLSLSEVDKAVGASSAGTHYGIQVKSTAAIKDTATRFARAGLKTRPEENATCCYAVQDKIWATDPDGNQWEVFVVLADANRRKDADANCCAEDCC